MGRSLTNGLGEFSILRFSVKAVGQGGLGQDVGGIANAVLNGANNLTNVNPLLGKLRN